MEEWVPPPPPSPPPPLPSDSGNAPFPNTLVPAQRQRSTYVVQVPKDQIYRIPPPENVDYVQRNGSPQSDKGTCTTCISRPRALLLIGLLLLVIVSASLYFAIRPKPPPFSISHVLVKNLNPTTTLGHHRRLPKPTYEITLESDNKNLVLGTSYQEGGNALLQERRARHRRHPRALPGPRGLEGASPGPPWRLRDAPPRDQEEREQREGGEGERQAGIGVSPVDEAYPRDAQGGGHGCDRELQPEGEHAGERDARGRSRVPYKVEFMKKRWR